MAELEQLALDATVAPAGILPGQPEDELVELTPGNRPPAARSSAIGGPLAADKFAMPAQQRLGAGQERSPGWPGQDAADRGQEETIRGLPAWPADLPLEHPKLVTQSQDFGAQPGVGPAVDDQDLQEEADDGVEEGVEHDRGASQRPLCGRGPASIRPQTR